MRILVGDLTSRGGISRWVTHAFVLVTSAISEFTVSKLRSGPFARVGSRVGRLGNERDARLVETRVSLDRSLAKLKSENALRCTVHVGGQAAAACGLPQLVLSLHSDQPGWGAAVTALHCGQHVCDGASLGDPSLHASRRAKIEELRVALCRTVRSERARAAAERLRAQLDADPQRAPRDAVDAIVRAIAQSSRKSPGTGGAQARAPGPTTPRARPQDLNQASFV